MTGQRNIAILGLLTYLSVVGFALMAFEMLGSRYLNPYFGGGITTWACLISIVLFAMMIGYFLGGYAVDAHPGVDLVIWCVMLGGLSIMIVPAIADTAIQFILKVLGDGFWGVFTASLCLSFAPVAMLSACSPCVVRLLLADLRLGGQTTGLVYSVSTLGNVAGTLVTTFYLIPNFGTRSITLGLGIMLMFLAGLLFTSKKGLERGLNANLIAGLGVWVLMCGADPVGAEKLPRSSWEASYPEGPIWIGERLLYTEMGAHRVVEWQRGSLREFWAEPGCGPTAIAPFRGSQFVVLCHLAGKVVQLDELGRKLGEFRKADDGELLVDPNDCFSDGQGGVFFTDSGVFNIRAPATGRVFHIESRGSIIKILDGLKYTNGIAVNFKRRTLLVSEHLARKVWEYDLRGDLSIGNRRIFLDVDKYLSTADLLKFPESGPDGIEIDTDGNVYIPVYGAGRIMVVMGSGEIREIDVEMQFVTNVAASASYLAIVGAFVNDRPPFPGRVDMVPRQEMLDKAKRNVPKIP